MRLAVRLTPRGGSNRVDGWGRDDAGRVFLKVRVRAAPVDGEANAALETFIARTLGVPAARVRVAAGSTARLKSLEIDGVDDAALAQAFGTP